MSHWLSKIKLDLERKEVIIYGRSVTKIILEGRMADFDLRLMNEFLEKWSVQRISEMTIDEYSKRGNQNTLTYWLEFKLKNYGSIKGGSSYKFGIFSRNDSGKGSNDNTRMSDFKYSWSRKYGQNAEKAFNNIKTSILKVIKLSMEGKITEIEKIDLPDVLKWKIAFLYHNHKTPKILMIFSKKILNYLTGKNLGFADSYEILLKKINSNDIYDYSEILWQKWDNFKNSKKLEFIKNLEVNQTLEIQLGKDDNWFRSYGSIENYFKSGLPSLKIFRHYAKERRVNKDTDKNIKTFILFTLKNDFIAGCYTTGAPNQEFDEKNQPYFSYELCDAIIYFDKPIDKTSMEKILGTKIEGGQRYNNETFGEYEELISKIIDLKYLKEENIMILDKRTNFPKPENGENGENKMSKSPLNLILYGPPGTGKTYNTINKALEIIVEKEKDNDVVCDKTIYEIKNILNKDVPSNEERKILQEAFKFFKEKGQIEFITFHQSYSYEDFVEGIKPIPPFEEDNEEMIFKTKHGIFKKTCEEALKKSEISKNSRFFRMALGRQNEKPFERVNYCIKNNLIGIGYDGFKYDLSNHKDHESIKNSNNNEQKTGSGQLDIFVNQLEKGDYLFITVGNKDIVGLCKVTGEYFFDEYPHEIMKGFEHQRKVTWLSENIALDVSVLGWETVPSETITAIRSEINFDEINMAVNKNFVLIIDEINRGNISKIFGELITLIEDDKRLGEENEMTVTLPYSKQAFGVPTNLHIVGTMNTADRSIALMDMALRRRFSFQEMMPRYDVLEGIKVEKDGKEIIISELLKKINERIEFLYDRDHTIGHAYFIKLKDMKDDEQYKELCSTFANKIIPLLQEYFYEDWEKIQIVLGDHIKQYKKEEKDECKEWDDEINKTRFIQSKISVETDVIGFNHNDFENSTVYRINPKLIENDMPEESFRKISEPAKKSTEEQDSKTKQ